MSDTYARLMEVKNGIYFQGVIQAMPVYKSDRKYGALISLIPPFNILVVPLLPYYIAATKPHHLEGFNRIVLRIFYSPVSLVTCILFTVVNIALIPFAYLYALTHKVLILVRTRTGAAFLELLVYLVFGLLFHLPTILIDFMRFIQLSFDENLTRVEKINYSTAVSKSAFDSVRNTIL